MDGRARLAWNLKHLRSARGLTQEALAIDSGVAAPYVNRIEGRKVNPTIDVLDRLAAALDIEVDLLLKAVDADSPPPQSLRPGRKSKQGREPIEAKDKA